MYSYRGRGGPRQPTPASVQCQKPSRTQQLLNPKLAPKLTNDAPEAATKNTGGAGQSIRLVTAATGVLSALSETTGLAVAITDRLSGAILQSLGEDNVRGLSSESVLPVLDATRPTLMTDDANNVAGDKIQDRRAAQVPETDVARLREPTGNTGIETMAEIRIEHKHQKLARRVDEFLRRNLSHHGSAV
ncbi:hypothetical protein SLS53_006334 [Cytospora paraplurivora]|uniref:Uncharacterized protein n=1 Tax=Cytospora paraplurivora TaxID=2898453 RepID=A0AAN9U672_9PEZI